MVNWPIWIMFQIQHVWGYNGRSLNNINIRPTLFMYIFVVSYLFTLFSKYLSFVVNLYILWLLYIIYHSDCYTRFWRNEARSCLLFVCKDSVFLPITLLLPHAFTYFDAFGMRITYSNARLEEFPIFVCLAVILIRLLFYTAQTSVTAFYCYFRFKEEILSKRGQLTTLQLLWLDTS